MRRGIGTCSPTMPMRPRRTRPCARIWLSTCSTVLDATEKQMPCANGIIAVLMPITSPEEETSGPPELPGLSAASVWITSPINRPFCARIERPTALTMPAVTVDWKPSGLPIAIAICPARTALESPAVPRPAARWHARAEQRGPYRDRAQAHVRRTWPFRRRQRDLLGAVDNMMVGQHEAVR